ncbi:DUF1835 domain-containing protein [Lactiplantibacillus fabifermentans]|uniref:DUF1835 domain-containing protein n=2 Tax=Lactiplantibacillus fabifermentans TaxID=483011 RepID=A0A0R2NR02_9LACO|nr:DUF3658 domain-containing protein [Lactiplantibacillus fabifermentans]ETY75100.1 hypothetical protein LFAB_03495 [Lactiplantibacillus fabifermentans T30PCM01]KRO27804.1 hypothetical protein DY78_GL002866 [Lactiplantibacillus fabifermentans DSM 21115]
MIEVTFNEELADTLATDRNDVICLPLYLGFGDLERLADSENTFWLIHDQKFADMQAAIQRLDSAVARHAQLRVWWSDQPDDYAGFCWLCGHLTSSGQLQQVHVPLTEVVTTPAVGLRQWAHIGELDQASAAHMSQATEPVTAAQRAAYSYLWESLADENAPVRINLNGNLQSAPVDCYDALIKMMPDAAAGASELGVPVWWCRERQSEIAKL